MKQQYPIVTAHDEAHTALRRLYYTASVIAAVANVHPYCSPLRLYMMRRGVEFPVDKDNPVFLRGHIYESAVGKAVQREHPEWKIEECNTFYCDDETLKGASPDFLIHGDPRGLGVLQAKTAAPSVFEREWRNGDVPEWIVMQALTEAELTDAAFAVVAALKIDAYDPAYVITEFPRHPAAEATLTEQVAAFEHNVELGIEPAPDFERDADLVKLLYPRHAPGQTLDLSGNNEIPMLLAQRALLRAKIDQASSVCETIETELKFLMGNAETVSGIDGWHITYKSTERKEYTVKATTMRILRIYDRRPESER